MYLPHGGMQDRTTMGLRSAADSLKWTSAIQQRVEWAVTRRRATRTIPQRGRMAVESEHSQHHEGIIADAVAEEVLHPNVQLQVLRTGPPNPREHADDALSELPQQKQLSPSDPQTKALLAPRQCPSRSGRVQRRTRLRLPALGRCIR